MSRGWKQLAALAALALTATTSVAFDNPGQQFERSPGVMFYFSVPLDARNVKEQKQQLVAGLALQGKREYETVRIDSRLFNPQLFNNFIGGGIEAKWIVAGVVAAGAVVAVASKSKSSSESYPEQQAAAASGGGTSSGNNSSGNNNGTGNNSTGGGGGGGGCPVTPACPG
jgi:uncharacterized membrane protein YgcG